MKRLLLLVLITAWTLTYAPGCGGTKTEAAAASPKPETTNAAQEEICETLPAPDPTLAAAAPDSTLTKAEPRPEPKPQANTEPKPEPRPEPPPKPRALPRMWDFGSTNCLPCMEMEKILTPLAAEYAGKVDIRIINVYQDREKTMQARIQVIPTQIFYDPDGKELFRHVGVYPRDSIVAKFKQFGWE
ncbi:MAG: thioredoxin family protein [candidate division WOR-3 bacterium]